MYSLKGEFRLLSSSNNTKSYAVAFILLLALSAMAAVLPAANAFAAQDRPTACYASTNPKLIGLNQELLVNLWIYPPPATPLEWGQGAGERFIGLTVTFTKPDGTTESYMPTEPGGILAPGQTERIGGLYFFYYPDQIGTWSVKCSFPGQTFKDWQNNTVYYKPSTSQTWSFTVQEDLVQLWMPDVALPTEYWARPINAENRAWSEIAGNWILIKGNFNPYSTGPNSAHILWKKEVSTGGLIGGNYGPLSYGAGGGTIHAIINGKIYGAVPNQSGVFGCYDLRTGQLLWTATGSPTFGWQARALPGATTLEQFETTTVVPYLWETSATGWKRYDVNTGAVLQNITNIPTGLSAGNWADGDPIVYCTQSGGFNTTGFPDKLALCTLIKWNYTKVTGNNWMTGVVYNVSLRQPDGFAPGDGRGSPNINIITPDRTFAVVKGSNSEYRMLGYNLETGTKVWDVYTGNFEGFGAQAQSANGPDLRPYPEKRTVAAYDIKTGVKLWESTVGTNPWSSNAQPRGAAYGNSYWSNYDGYVYIIDDETGEVTQSDFAGNTTETPWGTWGGRSGIIADNKVYIGTTEHSTTQPRVRGNMLLCYDAHTGKEIWRLHGTTGGLSAIADGVLIGTSEYDGVQYAFAKGKTTTTVSIQNDVITSGSSALIKGMVMDQSPAQPNTPAVSDASMSEWMEYLHMQRPIPTNTTGVEVTLNAIDSNGKLINIGKATSDMSGLFSYMWTPEVSGKYTIIATFAGSGSYWSSYGETALGVEAAPETGTNQPQTTVPDNIPILYAVVGVGIAIIIAVAIAVLILRKKQ